MSDLPNCDCSICGSQFESHNPALPSWDSEVILLNDWADVLTGDAVDKASQNNSPYETTSSDGIHQTAAHLGDRAPDIYSDFTPKGGGEDITAFAYISGAKDYVHLPVHNGCLSIAKRVIANRSTYTWADNLSGDVTSMRQLWRALHSRFDLVKDSFYHSMDSLGEPTKYSAGFSTMDDVRKAPHDWSRDLDVVFDEDPIEIPGVSEYIVSLLQPIPALPTIVAKGSQTSLAETLTSVPEDIHRHVLELLCEQWHNPPPSPQCIRAITIPSEWWRSGILGGKLLPFLWDLDTAAFDEKPASGWDYEALARKLGQTTVFESLHEPPEGLRNRRRIWKLVEDMYVGDEAANPHRSWLAPHFLDIRGKGFRDERLAKRFIQSPATLSGLQITSADQITCEVCGNFVYTGQEAFEKHFEEGRHNWGLRSLGAGNYSKNSDRITKIRDIVKLQIAKREERASETAPRRIWC